MEFLYDLIEMKSVIQGRDDKNSRADIIGLLESIGEFKWRPFLLYARNL